MENKVSVILEGLNDEQKNAVQAMEGPVLIVAGAGSGKTRVLTSRVAYILASGVSPARVLALTFTKKAAGEMKERIALMVGRHNASRVVMGTFHAVFVRFLREWAESIGYGRDFSIRDTSESQSTVKACIKELGLDDSTYKPKDVLSRISSAKNSLVTWDRYAARQDLLAMDSAARKPRICDIYRLYQLKLKQNNVMDFDDILLNMNILLRDNPEALQTLCERFSYIMVDEYQDTNAAQYQIIKKLTLLHHNICVVGDDSQSIYAFRGARVENILNFKKDFPECRIFRLERNYRSTKTIVQAANSLIAHNQSRIPKECYSEGEQGSKIRLYDCCDENDEAAKIAQLIYQGVNGGSGSYDNYAVLYRTNSQSRVIEEALRRRNIPYRVYSGNSFFDRAEVRDLMAYFKLCVNVNDDESFRRVVNKPVRGIGNTTMVSLVEAAQHSRTSLFKAVYLETLPSFGIKQGTIDKLRKFCDMINSYASSQATREATELAESLAVESGLYAFYKLDTSPEGRDRFENVQELLNSVAVYVEERRREAEENEEECSEISLADYLENAALLSNADTAGDEEKEQVSLMTVHSSKGLEYPHVIIAGMENNLFPSSSMLSSPNEIEEERRLFYVALTRAQTSVSLTCADSRMRNGKTEWNPVSMFVKEIDPQYLDAPLLARAAFGSGSSTGSVGRTGFGSTGFSRQPASGQFSRGGGFRQQGPAYMVSSGKRSIPVPDALKTAQAAPKPVLRPSAPPAPVADFVPEEMTVFQAGQRVEHNRFGKGRIVSVTGMVPELKAIVDFDAYGTKTLLLKYAKMRRL